MPKLTSAELMLYSTVKLTTYASGVELGTGTGFFFRVDCAPDLHAVIMVTNKHVMEGADEVVMHLHVGQGDFNDGPSGEVLRYLVRMTPMPVTNHPDDDVDLCYFSMVDAIKKSQQVGKPLYIVALCEDDIPAADEWQYFDAIEEVTMIGCPRGIFDEKNNIPIARRGITATPLSKLYNGKPEFMVDMACFPGSSGSPVFVYDRIGYLDRKTNIFQMGSQRVKFVGVLFAGPLITNEGKVVMGHSGSFEVATMMHLGYAVRSSEIAALSKIVRATVVPSP